MNTKRPFIPGILHKLDEYLLLHHPETWTARTHLVLYYGLLTMALIAGISFVIPDDPRNASPAGYWIGFVCILSILGIVGWLIYLLRFNVFKRFGTITPLSGLKVFILYFIATAVFVLFPYMEPIVESIRANKAYGNNELVQDVNTINTRICELEYDSLSHRWDSDTFLLRNTPLSENSSPAHVSADYTEVPIEASTDTIYLEPIPPISILDSIQLSDKRAGADSSIQLNDSMFVFFEAPTYAFLTPYKTGDHSTVKQLSSFDIYQQTIRNFKRPNKAAARKELEALVQKYLTAEQKNLQYYPNYENSGFMERTRNKYRLSNVSNSIENIAERKYRWEKDELKVYFRIFFYTTFILSMLVFVFRHTTKSSFFLTLLTALILTILTALFSAFTNQDEIGVLSILLLYFIAFFAVSFSSWGSKKRAAVAGISLNLWVLLLPFVPLIAHILYYSILLKSELSYSAAYDIYRARMENNLLYAELAGILLFILALAFYIRKAYRQWYALPEN